MKRLKNLILVFCAGLALSACSSLGERMGMNDHDAAQESSVQSIDLMAKNQGRGIPVRVDPAAAIAHNTDGRVQIFGLDDAGNLSSAVGEPGTFSGDTGVSPLRAVSLSGPVSSTVFSGDPSVEVFSLDGEMTGDASSGASAWVSRYPAVRDSAEGAGITIIYFDHDSNALSPEALEAIARVSKAFNPALGQGIDVAGHASVMANYTDEVQRKIVNLKISMDRAMAVSRALIKQGVPAEAIRVTAWGEIRPPRELEGKTPEEAARRVEISGQGLM